MTNPTWVTRQQVAFIHDAVIEMGGGSYGLRDAALLESVEHAEMMEQLGQGNITRDQAAAHLRKHSEPM